MRKEYITMRKFIRNDYTFINRLERIQARYLKQEQGSSISSYLSSQGLRMYLKIGRWIDDIKEDMRLKLNQRLLDVMNKNSNDNILNIQTEMSLMWFMDNKEIFE